MSHLVTELLARERIADWHREANDSRLVRVNPKARLVPQRAMQGGHTSRHGPLVGWRGPIGRLTGWLGQVRLVARGLALGA
jgi:hypothetical protein